MGNISIILRRPPYGTADASEAVRHLLGAAAEGLSAKLILVDGGAVVARKGQNTGATEYLSIEAGIVDCIDMGAAVYVDEKSLDEALLKAEDLVDGVKISSSAEIAEILRMSDTTMIF
ncbi:MAG: DsrE family protein [Nitrospiraceae bacterium]|nr:DsrE family protein [Nitrospiraceae bacterium]